MSTKVTVIFSIAWEQACHRLMNLKVMFNLRELNEFLKCLYAIPNSMLETGTVFSCLTFDLESGKLEIELRIRTLLL